MKFEVSNLKLKLSNYSIKRFSFDYIKNLYDYRKDFGNRRDLHNREFKGKVFSTFSARIHFIQTKLSITISEIRKIQPQVICIKLDQNLTVGKKKSLLRITNVLKITKLISYQSMSEPWDISKVKRRVLHLIWMKKKEDSFAEKVQLK